MQRTTKGFGICGLSRLSTWLVWHGPEVDGPVVLAVGAQLRVFLLAATPTGVSASKRVGHLSPGLRSVLGGHHWLTDQRLPAQLACLGFVSAGWSLIRDLLARRQGRAMHKAHELVCWWRVGDRIAPTPAPTQCPAGLLVRCPPGSRNCAGTSTHCPIDFWGFAGTAHTAHCPIDFFVCLFVCLFVHGLRKP